MCASSWSTTSPRSATPLDRALRLDGYRVQLAADGREALDALAHTPPDAIVLDVLMPEPDGLEVCRRLRAAGDRTPVLMLTARDAVPDRVRGLDAGADDYLVKPFALEELRRPPARAAAPRPAGRSSDDAALRRPRARPRRAHRAPRRRGGSSSPAPSSCCSSCSCATRARC